MNEISSNAIYFFVGMVIGIGCGLLMSVVIVEDYIGMPAAYHQDGYACYHVSALITGGSDNVWHEICHEPNLEAKCKEYGVPHEQ